MKDIRKNLSSNFATLTADVGATSLQFNDQLY